MDLLRFEEHIKGLGVLGIKVTQHGQDIAYRRWDEECRRNVYSASKSFTALAVGFAMQEGLLSLDEKLTDAFPDDAPAAPSANLRSATVRDLLTMHLGQAAGHLMGAQRPLYQEDDWVKLALSIPFDYAPGEKFVYNNVGPYLAGVLVQRRAGRDLVAYLTPRLFAPLGIKRPTWECDPLGYTFGAGGLFLTLSELHKLGLLCLQKGAWNGRQLIDPSWIEACAAQQGTANYGYLFWRGKHGSYRADGKYCQFSIVYPAEDAVASVVAECRDGERLMQAIDEDIYAQL